MGIFHHGSSNDTCPTHSLSEDPAKNFIGDMSFHKFNVILSGACGLFAVVVMLIFKEIHATHLLVPAEQVKIMRISLLITMFSVISFLCVCYPSAAVYIKPWLDFVEAISLGSFFLLLCEYISPNHEQRYVFFAAKRVDGVKWFKSRWFLIFQFPVVALIVAIATDITQAAGVYCQFSSKPHFAHFWLNLIKSISLALSVMAILRFYKELKTELAQHKPLMKLIAFKAVVFLTFVESIIFWILTDVGALKPTDTLTYADLNIGIPSLLVCIEMVPLSIFFCWAYPWSPYNRENRKLNVEGGAKITQSYQGGFLGIRAWLDMMNPMETIKAVLFGLKMFASRNSGDGNMTDGYERTSRDPLYENTAYDSRYDSRYDAGAQQGRY